jgi:hypothetical protein
MISNEIDAIYFSYRKPQIAEKVMLDFMKSYPKAHVTFVVDSGGIESRVIESLENVAVYKSSNRISASQSGLYISEKTLRTYLQYLQIACQKNPEKKWMFILEDDVKVFYSVNSLHYDLNGINRNEKLNIKIRLLLKMLGCKVSKQNRVGGFGGSIYNKSIVNSYPILEWENKLKLFIKIMNRPLGSDEIISIMNTVVGGTVGHYDGLCEVWYKDYERKLNEKTISTLHKYLGYADE